MKIFVYGTLKRGQPLHYALRDQQFVGDARTLPQYQMFSLGDYPGVVMAASAEVGQAIEGEVWEVDAICLAELDEIEAVDEGEYERVRMPLGEPFHDTLVEGYLYLGDVSELGEVGTLW